MRSAVLVSLLIAMQFAIPPGIAAAADAAKPAATAAPDVTPVSQPPAAVPIVGNADAGGHLYATVCAYCHRMDGGVSEVGAPGLKGAVRRYGEAWLDRWLADPRAFAGSDAKAKALLAANPYGLVMPRFPVMQDAQNRADIIAFLKALDSADGKDEPAAQ